MLAEATGVWGSKGPNDAWTLDCHQISTPMFGRIGDPTSAGMHAGPLTFTATKSGTYQYFCPVPGLARDGMVGTFVVAG